jgi:hypothetical protein
MEENNSTTGNALEEAISMEGYDKPVRNARIILFVAAAMQLFSIFTIGNLPQPNKALAISINIFIAIVYILLALWTMKRPYTAIITALVFYTSWILLNAVLQPATLIQGFILKILVYVLLIMALNNAREVQRWKDTLNK